MNFDIIFDFVSLILLLALSAFFSGSETGLFSLSSVRIHRLQEEKKKGAFVIAQILKEPRHVLATILLANLFVNIFSTSLAEEISLTLFGPKGLQICIIVMTIIILVFCEIVPKVVAVSLSERVALQVAPAIRLVMLIITPIRVLFLKLANRLISWILPKELTSKEPLNSDQLKTAVRLGYQEQILNGQESVMLEGVIELKDKTVKEIMTPRDKIFAFEIETPLLTVYEEIRKRGISRIPIYRKTLDQVVGILYAKDIIMKEILELQAIQIYDLLRSPFFVQEWMRMDKILSEFRTKRLHMALVLGSDGKLTGLITLDDLIEAIVGKSLEQGI